MRKKVKVLVLGAGAGGLGASVWLKEKGIDFMVVDGLSELPLNLHNGVHYLHKIPKLPFKTDIKRITLTDAILHDGKMYDKPSLNFALKYSEKVREIQHPSSIMNVGKEDTAYMPKSNSLNTLLQEMYDFSGEENFEFGCWLKEINTELKVAIFDREEGPIAIEYENLISTAPLDKIALMLNFKEITELKLDCAPVYITNYKVDKIVPNWMINIYIPESSTLIYRASILNGVCSVESTKELTDHEVHSCRDFLSMFHLSCNDFQKYKWKTGKVISISKDERERMVDVLAERNIYLIGRFGLWNRKLLIDSTIEQARLVVESISGGDWNITRDFLIK